MFCKWRCWLLSPQLNAIEVWATGMCREFWSGPKRETLPERERERLCRRLCRRLSVELYMDSIHSKCHSLIQKTFKPNANEEAQWYSTARPSQSEWWPSVWRSVWQSPGNDRRAYNPHDPATLLKRKRPKKTAHALRKAHDRIYPDSTRWESRRWARAWTTTFYFLETGEFF